MSSTATVLPRRARKRPVIHVFNPTQFSDSVAVGGHFFSFAPRSVGECTCAHHQRDKGEDPTGVHELMEWPRTERGKLITAGGLGTREVVMAADKVADHIVSPECRGGKEYIILEGTPDEQEDQKRAAIDRWNVRYLADAEQTIATWESHVASLKSMRPGDPPPRRPRHVVAAYQFSDNHVAMAGRKAKFVCDLCGWDGLDAEPQMPDTGESLAWHRRRRHPGVAMSINAEMVAAMVADDEPPAATTEDFGESTQGELAGSGAAKPGDAPAPPSAPDPEGDALVRRSKAHGMALGVADKKGLHHGDMDVIADVKKRLDEHVAAKKKAVEKPTDK